MANSYNATLFDSVATTSYSVLGVQPSFLGNSSYDLVALNITDNFRETEANYLQSYGASFERLDNRQCLDAYRQSLVPNRGDLLIVLDVHPAATSSNSSIVTWHDSCFDCAGDIDWLCEGVTPPGKTCTSKLIEAHLKDAGNWTVGGGLLGNQQAEVQYCLSQRTEERCALKCSRVMTIIVIAWNVIKTACFIVAAMDSRLSLLKVGDAIYSFLRTPDDTLAGSGQLPPKRAFEREWRRLGLRSSLRDDWMQRYSGGHVRRWWSAVGSGRWFSFGLICIVAIGLGGGLLGHTLHKLNGKYPQDFGHLWTLGFGTVTGYELLQGGVHTGIIGNSVIANLPQLMISSMYFTLLSIATSQLVEREWNRFGYEPRRLRTTFPSPGESSMWYLSVPYSYSGPLLVLFIWLHLCVSQSLFAAEVSFYTYDGRLGPLTFTFNETIARTEGLTLSTLCAAPVAIIVAFWLLAVIVILVGLNARRMYHPEMPYPGSDTTVIAACTRSDQEAESLLQGRIMWRKAEISDQRGMATGSFYACDAANEKKLPERLPEHSLQKPQENSKSDV